MRFYALCGLVGLAAASCRLHPYDVIPRSPEYLLRSPNSHETPLRDVLLEYNGFVRGRHSIDLRLQMQIRIENAYYEKGYSRKGLNGYLGTEVARYEVKTAGMHLLSVEPMKGRPEADRPVQDLVSQDQLKFRYYRLYFEILFDRKTDAHGSVLLAANTIDELTQRSTQLSRPLNPSQAQSTGPKPTQLAAFARRPHHLAIVAGRL